MRAKCVNSRGGMLTVAISRSSCNYQDMLDQSQMPINKDQNSGIDPNVDQ